MSVDPVVVRSVQRSRMVLSVAAVFVLIASLLVASPGSARAAVAEASVDAPTAIAPAVAGSVVKTADLSKFQPGNIMSDAVFFNRGTMTEAQIQSFLQSKVPSCRAGYVCLKDWYDTSRSVGADAMCGSYSGGVRERASRIIYKVAQACGINPQVILATLQKEQGLVDHVWPSEWRYTIAMGQGCPDTAACDTRYYGFFNQVFGAAWQFKRYANPPGTSQYFTWYAPGRTWNVRWHPNAACGSTPVHIQNQATANLYYYTPYQPNAAAIRAYSGEGDGCSSYGNRNFFRYFTDWFGSTQSGAVADPCAVPVGSRRATKAYVVNAGSLNARTAPNTACAKDVQNLPGNTVVRAVAVNGDWLKVMTPTRDRWVHRDYVRYASASEAACALPGGVTGAGLAYVVTSPTTATRVVPNSSCGAGAGQLPQGSIVQAFEVSKERAWVKVHTGAGDRWVNRGEMRRATSSETACALPGGVGAAGYQYVVKSSGTAARTAPHAGCNIGRKAVSGGTVVQAVHVDDSREWLKVTTGNGDYWVSRADVGRASVSQACSAEPATRGVSRGYVVIDGGATGYAKPSTACATGTTTIPAGTVFTPLGSTSAGDWLKVRYGNADRWIPRSSVRYAGDAEICSTPAETRAAAYTYRVVTPATGRLAPRAGCAAESTSIPVDTVARAVEVTGDGEWLKLSLPGGERWIPRADVVRQMTP